MTDTLHDKLRSKLGASEPPKPENGHGEKLVIDKEGVEKLSSVLENLAESEEPLDEDMADMLVEAIPEKGKRS